MEWDPDVLEDAQDVVERVAKKFKRKYWWADQNELEQEAWVAVLKAMPNFDGRWGADALEGYLWKAACYAVRPFIWKSVAVVSAPYHKLNELFDVKQEPLSESMIDNAADLDEMLDRARWLGRVRKHLSVIFKEVKDGELAEARLMAGFEPETIAIAYGVSATRIYKACRAVRRRIESDYDLFKLWRREG